MKPEIKVIKLINGDDVVCQLPTGEKQLPENGPLIRLVKPLLVRYVPQMTPAGFRDYIALTKWAAYTPDNVITIPKDKIMTVTNASMEMTKSWSNISEHYNQVEMPKQRTIPENKKMSDDDMRKMNEIFDMYEDDEEDPTVH
tara:strand:+ start:695 stop:1120 length:426 start_codon:yes stop_codon:yes gene_type:complete